MNFTLVETTDLKEINSTGYLYEHNETKAKVAFVLNDDTNKTFAISFATPPYNDNGIAHILEHSVLCGSRKYPSKEPFVELAKGSLNTFLNAFTFSDKTMYPVASQNNKDFYNLMDVYLDAVFFPNLINDPSILQQEGWHYHLENKEDELIYKGVVYNEMKGVFADPQQVINRHIQSQLFPDTVYAHESGGDPKTIPTLTQDEFITFHDTYYHPSNSFSFIYGNVDIAEQLAHLDTYFSQFHYKAVENKLQKQPAFEIMQTMRIPYSIAEQDDSHEKTFIGLDFVVGESKDMALNTQFSILSEVLVGSNASPLWKNLMESGIAHDIVGSYDNYTLQSIFSVMAKNSEPEHVDTFKKIVFDTLTELVENGIPSKLLTGAINRIKFSLKEGNFDGTPKGILYAITTTGMFIHGGSPFDALLLDEHIKFVEENPHVLIDLIQEKLLNNSHVLLTIATPEHNLLEKEVNKTQEELQNYKKQLTDEQLETIIKNTQALLEKQNTPDSTDALASIPTLTLNDLNKDAKALALNVDKNDTVTYLHHPTFTSGINYIHVTFNLEHLSLDELRYASLIAKLQGNLATTKRSLDDLTIDFDIYTGGVSTYTNVYKIDKEKQIFHPEFVIKGKAFSENIEQLLALEHEMLTETDFNQPNKLLEQLRRLKTELEAKFRQQGHQVAYSQLMTSYSKADVLEQEMTGLKFYQFLCDILADFDENSNHIISTLQNVTNKLYTQHNLIVEYIATEEDYAAHIEKVKQFVGQFTQEQGEKQNLNLVLSEKTLGLSFDSEVNYVAQGYNLYLAGLNYNSQLLVLKNILQFGYLWNNVRVKGGAYGAFPIMTRQGDIVFVSYRDPNIDETITTYEKAGQFISELELDERELTKAIIGTFSDLDAPLTPKRAGELAFTRYRLNIDFETIQNERTNILNTTTQDLQKLADYIVATMKEQHRIAVGNTKLLEESNFITNVIPLIK